LESRGVNVVKGFILIIVALWSLLVLGFFAMVGYSWYGILGAVAIDLVLIIGTVFMLWVFK
jgi:hypothetical protein